MLGREHKSATTYSSIEDSYFASFLKKFLHSISVLISAVIPDLRGSRSVRTKRNRLLSAYFNLLFSSNEDTLTAHDCQEPQNNYSFVEDTSTMDDNDKLFSL